MAVGMISCPHILSPVRGYKRLFVREIVFDGKGGQKHLLAPVGVSWHLF